MDLFRARHRFWLLAKNTEFKVFEHPGCPPSIEKFNVYIPHEFYLWDENDGALAFPLTGRPNALCRCGVVQKAAFFKIGDPRTVISVGLKIMNRNQLILQKDDVENEIRVMQQLQPSGLSNPRSNPHFLLWETKKDDYNEYIAIEYAEQGSLIQYIRNTLRTYREEYIKKTGEKNIIFNSFLKACGKQIFMRCLHIYADVIYALCYMHGQNVCHLDLDPRNIVMDKKSVIKIIDFGSSAIMDGKFYAGQGDSLIKFKPNYVAPEVKLNNLKPAPRNGFNGCAADMYSAGVLLYQLLTWCYPGGERSLSHDRNWKFNLFRHIERAHPQEGENCYLCYRHIEIPETFLYLLGMLLQDKPKERMKAIAVAEYLESHYEGLQQRRTSRAHYA